MSNQKQLSELLGAPTPDQIERFSKLTAEQRFHWLVDTITLCFELSTPEVRASWHKQKAARGR